jgi:hypothetical protein
MFLRAHRWINIQNDLDRKSPKPRVHQRNPERVLGPADRRIHVIPAYHDRRFRLVLHAFRSRDGLVPTLRSHAKRKLTILTTVIGRSQTVATATYRCSAPSVQNSTASDSSPTPNRPKHRRYCPGYDWCLPEGSPLSRRRPMPPSKFSSHSSAGGSRRGTLLALHLPIVAAIQSPQTNPSSGQEIPQISS